MITNTMKSSIILLGFSVALAAVIPPQHPLRYYGQSESQPLRVDTKGSSDDSSTTHRTVAVVNTEDGGLGSDISRQWSGYLDSGNDTNLFFWMFESRKDPANDPVILWLGGDPGVSSMFAALKQWGPKRMLNDGSFIENPAAMNEAATIIFLDHLVGTGFSYATQETRTDSTAKSSADVIQFLEAFFRTSFAGKTFSGLDFHIGGEYYAGHYIPSIARSIVSRPPEDRFNLKSVMIGNGWFDALTQQRTIYQQICDAELTSNLERMLNDDECNRWLENLRDCEESIIECRRDATRCTQLEKRCSQSDARNYDNVRRSDHYELTKHCDYETPRNRFQQFLIDARSSMGVDLLRFDGEKRTSSLDRPSILQSFKDNGDYTQDLVPDLGSLLSSTEVRVLLFAGTGYLKAPYLGTKAVAQKVEWPGQDAFNEAMRAPHHPELGSLDGNTYGEYVKVSDSESRTLMSVGLYGAGDTADEQTGAQVKALLYQWMFNHIYF